MGRKKKRKSVLTSDPQKDFVFRFMVGWGLPAALCLTGLGMLVKASNSLPGSTAHTLVLTGLILLGGGTGFLAARSDWFKNPAASQKTFRAVVFLVGVSLGFCIFKFGMCQFGGFDHSAVIDVGWRLVQGQKAYIDFPCTLPPAFFLGAKFAFQLFGVAWQSLILFTVMFSLVIYVWSLLLLIGILHDRLLALLMAVTIQATSLLLVSYWWYNPITSATAAVFMLSAVLWWHLPERPAARVSYFCALFLMALMKPNVAGVIVPLTSVVFFFSKRHRFQALILTSLAFAACGVLLWLNQVSLPALLEGYLTVARRGATLQQFLQDLSPREKALSLEALAAVILPAVISSFKGRSLFFVRRPWLALAGLVAGGYGFLTNGELKLVDMPLILIASLLLVFELNKNVPYQSGFPSSWRRYFIVVCVVLTFAGWAQGFTRHRVKAIGFGVFFQYQLARTPVAGTFFKNLMSGDILRETYQQIEDLLHKEPKSSVMFGPRMQWGYAAFNRPSPRGQPICWHPGVTFAAADEERYVSRLIESRFGIIILNKNDSTYFSRDFMQSLRQHYVIDQSYPRLTVLKIKDKL